MGNLIWRIHSWTFIITILKACSTLIWHLSFCPSIRCTTPSPPFPICRQDVHVVVLDVLQTSLASWCLSCALQLYLKAYTSQCPEPHIYIPFSCQHYPENNIILIILHFIYYVYNAITFIVYQVFFPKCLRHYCWLTTVLRGKDNKIEGSECLPALNR